MTSPQVTEAAVWVIEVRLDGRWRVGETVSLRPAVYLSRADARRDIYNREVTAWDKRIRKYTAVTR